MRYREVKIVGFEYIHVTIAYIKITKIYVATTRTHAGKGVHGRRRGGPSKGCFGETIYSAVDGRARDGRWASRRGVLTNLL